MDEKDVLIKQQQAKIEHLSSELKKVRIDYENVLYDWNELNVKVTKLKVGFKVLANL